MIVQVKLLIKMAPNMSYVLPRKSVSAFIILCSQDKIPGGIIPGYNVLIKHIFINEICTYFLPWVQKRIIMIKIFDKKGNKKIVFIKISFGKKKLLIKRSS